MIRPPPRSTLFPYTTLFPISVRRTVTAGTGDQVVGTVAADGTRTVVEPDGTRIVRTFGTDPRFGMTAPFVATERSEENTSELQSRQSFVCRLLLEKKKTRCTH